jgi:hypothetical protein
MEQSSRRQIANLQAIMPTLALTNPDLLDQLHGSRGSAAGMSLGVTRGLMFMRDRGQYADMRGSGQLTQDLFERLYSGDSNMNGVRATQAGNMFAEMSGRGYMSGARSTEQIAQRMRDMSGAVSAIRDLFGANGRPNAPMQEIFNALDQLTSSQSSWMDPNQVQMQIRRVQALTRHTAGGLRQYTREMDEGSRSAESIGLNRYFGVQAAESSTAFGIAFQNVAGRQGFNGLSADQARGLDRNLRLGAAASGQANALGSLMALAEQGQIAGVSRGQDGRLRVTGNSQAAQLVQAVLSRDQRALQQYAGLDQSQMMGILQQSGVSSAVASQFVSAGAANQEQIQQYGIANLVRGNQSQGEVRNLMNAGLQSGMVSVLREGGFDPAETHQVATTAANAARQSLMSMPAEIRSDPNRREERNRVVAQAVRNAVGPQAAARLGEQGLQNLVAASIRSLEGMIQRDPRLRQFQNLNSLISMMSSTVQSEANAVQSSASAEAQMSSLTASIGQGTPLANVMQAVASAGPNTNLTSVIASALGGQNQQNIAAALAGPASQVTELMQEYQSLQAQMANATPEQREVLQRKMDQVQSQLAPMLQQLQQVSSASGMDALVGVESAQTQAAEPQTAAGTAMSWLGQAGSLVTGGLSSLLMRQNGPMQPLGPGPGPAEAMAAAFPGGLGQPGGGPMHIRGTLTLRADGAYDLAATPNDLGSVPSPG